jgi:hypothetical protein
MTKNNFVQTVGVLVLWVIFTALGGCTADFFSSKDNPPKIANLVYIPQKAPVEEGKTTSIIGSFDIIHKNGENVSVNYVAYGAGGTKVTSGSIPLTDKELKTSDTLGFGFDMSTAKKGDYTFEVSITDSKGKTSNQLDGIFSVTDIY